MYTVLGHPRSRTMRVVWALEEMGLDYVYEKHPPRAPAVLAINPSGKIPVLKTPEGVVSDSVAIMTWLADRHGRLTRPAGSYERAIQDSLTNYILGELDAALWLYAKHSFVLPEEWRVEAVKPTVRKEFERAMGYLAEHFGSGPFLVGEEPTIPDLLVSHCAEWGRSIGFDLPGGAFGDWLAALASRPAAQRAAARMAA